MKNGRDREDRGRRMSESESRKDDKRWMREVGKMRKEE